MLDRAWKRARTGARYFAMTAAVVSQPDRRSVLFVEREAIPVRELKSTAMACALPLPSVAPSARLPLHLQSSAVPDPSNDSSQPRLVLPCTTKLQCQSIVTCSVRSCYTHYGAMRAVVSLTIDAQRIEFGALAAPSNSHAAFFYGHGNPTSTTLSRESQPVLRRT